MVLQVEGSTYKDRAAYVNLDIPSALDNKILPLKERSR